MRRTVRLALQLCRQSKTIDLRQIGIDKCRMEGMLLERFQGCTGALDGGSLPSLSPQHGLQETSAGAVVLDDQYRVSLELGQRRIPGERGVSSLVPQA
jgi:hypothetical protein